MLFRKRNNSIIQKADVCYPCSGEVYLSHEKQKREKFIADQEEKKMKMIKTLTVDNAKGVFFILLFCWGLAGIVLWHYGSDTLGLIQGRIRPEALKEDTFNYYGMSGLALFFILLGAFILIKDLTHSVKKRVNQYLSEHPDVTLEMLDEDFSGAEKFYDIWVGEKYTYTTELKSILLENDRIVWVHQDVEYSRRTTSYFVCWCMVDGQEYRTRITEKNLRLLREHYLINFTHILTEDNPDYRNMFKHNLDKLLDIRYNQYVQH